MGRMARQAIKPGAAEETKSGEEKRRGARAGAGEDNGFRAIGRFMVDAHRARVRRQRAKRFGENRNSCASAVTQLTHSALEPIGFRAAGGGGCGDGDGGAFRIR